MVSHASLPQRRRSPVRAGHLFVAPYLGVLVLFGLAPAVYALVITFADYTNGTPVFFAAGWRNYHIATSDFRFMATFINVGKFLLISVPLGLIVVILLALLLHARPGPFASIMRTIYFLPGAASGPALVLIAIFMFNPQLSPFAPVLHALHQQSLVDVVSPAHLPFLFALISLFGGAGSTIAILYGALNGISPEILEAATIDGCNTWQAALYIKFPLISKYLTFFSILSIAGSIQLFAEPQLIGAAGSAPLPIFSPNQLAYNFAFVYGNFGAASVIALIMLGIGLVAAFLVIYGTQFYRTDYAAS